MRLTSCLVSFVVCISSVTWAAPAAKVEPKTPDVNLTPGDLCTKQDPDYVGVRYKEKIPYCQRNVSFSHRQNIYDAYNVPARIRSKYTIDHFIPLSLGGSNSSKNLWPEHKTIKALRQDLELLTFIDLEDGTITQAEAIQRVTEAKMNPGLFLPYLEYLP